MFLALRAGVSLTDVINRALRGLPTGLNLVLVRRAWLRRTNAPAKGTGASVLRERECYGIVTGECHGVALSLRFAQHA